MNRALIRHDLHRQLPMPLQIERQFAGMLAVKFDHVLKQRFKPSRGGFVEGCFVFVLGIDGVLVKPFQCLSGFRLHGYNSLPRRGIPVI